MNELKVSCYYGTKAREIYDECCKTLGFDKSLSGNLLHKKGYLPKKQQEKITAFGFWLIQT